MSAKLINVNVPQKLILTYQNTCPIIINVENCCFAYYFWETVIQNVSGFFDEQKV